MPFEAKVNPEQLISSLRDLYGNKITSAHIKAYWIMLGIGTAQTALDYGADDLDGTVRHELIYHDAGATTPEELTVEQLKGLIREAGREPVERNTVYNEVIRDTDNPADWRIGEALTVSL